MLSLRASICTCISEFLILSAMSAGQSARAPSPGSAEQPFTAIQTSLALAADSALNTTMVEEPTVTSRNPGRETDAITTSTPTRNSHPAIGRFEALRPVIEPILVRQGVPEGLAAVVLVESAGNPFALSPKGARGLWQLMPETARRYGLRVDSRADDRIDVSKSTIAAAQYLHDLYVQFGSWPMALAAYNTGEQHLLRAIDRAGSNEFATISFLRYIPDETRSYVPAVLAAMETHINGSSQQAQQHKPASFVYAFSAPQYSR